MSRTILVLLGPNLSKLLGPLENTLKAENTEFIFVQANGEGLLIDSVEAETFEAAMVDVGVLSPAAFALAEALELAQVPYVEVQSVVISPARGPSALTQAIAQVNAGDERHQRALTMLLEKLPPPAPAAPNARPRANAPRGKTIGRRPEPEPVVESESRGKSLGKRSTSSGKALDSASLLTKLLVAKKINARLKGELSATELSAWARVEWQKLQAGGPCEEPGRATLDLVLLTLMAGPKASDDVLLNQVAKLER
jgi:3-dehydroquinate dehydratase II